MDAKYSILILVFGYLNNTFFAKTMVITTEKQPPSTLFTSSILHISANSQNTTGNPLAQPMQLNNIPSGQATSAAKVTHGQPTPATEVLSRKPAVYVSETASVTYNVTRLTIPVSNTSFSQTAPVITSARQLPPSAYASTRQPPTPPSAYTPTQQPSLTVHTSGKPVLPTNRHLLMRPASTIKYLTRITPVFILETTTNKGIPSKTSHNSTAAILIGIILTCMLVSIIIIVLWKCLRKPVSNDQNWAGRSPFADGETPDICMDNIKENEVSLKRTSIISLMTWKPSKNILLADDLEIKLFESSENIEDANNPKTEKIKDQVNGTSEDSAGGSTIGTAVSSSDEADLPPPPPLVDSGQESNQPDTPTVTILSPLPSDPTNPQPPLESLNEAREDHISETEQSFPPCPDSLNLPLPPGDFMNDQEETNNEIQGQFSTPPASDQDVSECLPPPPAELL